MATIRDVAKLAGVGVGTASRAISGRGAIALDTLARVQQAVQELGFRPSNVARALSLKSLGMIGVYVPVFEGTFYAPILAAIDAELRAVDRHMVAAAACGRGDARQQALDGVEFLMERQCDGIIVVSNDLTDDDLTALQRRFPRLVVLNRSVPGRPTHGFSSDHHAAGRLAARALLSRGHRDIACVWGPRQAPDNAARMAGFRAELARHRVKLERAHQADGDFGVESGHAAAEQLLARGAFDRCSALFCANDSMAIGAMSCLHRAGIDVPRRLSVIGYDDSAMAAYTAPALTTVRIPIADAAVAGCRFLLELCYGLALPVQRALPPAVVWRASVGNGPHALLALDPVTGAATDAAVDAANDPSAEPRAEPAPRKRAPRRQP
jgi:LacI family transcriptional regulator